MLCFFYVNKILDGTVKPKCFLAKRANKGELMSDKAFAWYILYTYLITLDLR